MKTIMTKEKKKKMSMKKRRRLDSNYRLGYKHVNIDSDFGGLFVCIDANK